MKTFETTTELMPHQAAAVEKIKSIIVGALFMEMGTGKSRTAIELAKIRANKIDKIIWYCPVSLKATIYREIHQHTNCEDVYVFDGTTKQHNIPISRWYIIGVQSMSASNRIVAAANSLTTDKTMVILDESSYIKGHNSMRTKRITMISVKAKYRIILTGTPVSQGIVDLFAQMKFLSPKILGYNSFYSFAANHLEYSEKFPGMIVMSHNIPFVAAKINPYVYQVTKAECMELPPKVYDSRYFYMTEEQRKYYELAKEEILFELTNEDDYMNSIVIFRLFTALQQIVSGFWSKNNDRIKMRNARIRVLINAVEDIPSSEKIIIFAKFQYDIDQIVEALTNKYGKDTVSVYTGKLSEKDRDSELHRFKKDARFFIATQSSGGYGLTLNEAHYVIFYNNAFKYSERLQAEDRCHRIGQEHKVTYIDLICADSIDERIEFSMRNKSDAVQDFKSAVGKIKGKKAKAKELIKGI